MPQIRLDKYLSDLGLGSRRDVRDMIRAGRVTVDELVVLRPEQKLDTDRSAVRLDGRELRYQVCHYFMMDKPEGVLTATEDARQRTVLDLLPPELRRLGLFPVGRLDKDTSGLLILTDDGDFAHRVMSPKSGVWKCYRAEVEGVPDADDAAAFRAGLLLDDGTRCLPAQLACSGESVCHVTVQEGKYHQVKRMLAACGKPVRKLRRLSIGGLQMDESLGPGGFREIAQDELCTVFMGR